MKRSISTCFAATVASLLLSPAPGGATTYIKASDAILADQAELIVEVRILDVDRSPGIGRPVTDYVAAVERRIAGGTVASPLTVRVPGGLMPEAELEMRVFGAPWFRQGERALLFLENRPDGTYRILHLMQGAFHVVESSGRSYVLRNLADTHEVRLSEPETPRAEQPRDLERFRAWLVDRAAGSAHAADYFVDDDALLEKFTLLRARDDLAVRWRQFDTGGSVTFRAQSSGQPGLSGGGFGEFQAALGAWNNDPSTPIRLGYGGQTGVTTGFQNCDGQNVLLFDDPNDELDASSFNCSAMVGTLAAASICSFNAQTHTHNGTTFHPLAEGDIITNENIECWVTSRRVQQLFTHEVGHTLGLGHSCGDDASGPCNTSTKNNATMRATFHHDNRGAALATDDRDGIRFVYGEPLTRPEAPSELTATMVADHRIDLSWKDNSSEETSFEIERAAGGGFQRLLFVSANATTYQDTSALSGTTHSYRVRALNSAGSSAFSNTASATTPGEPGPSDLAASAISTSAIRLTWQDNSSGETGFEIEGKTDGSFSLFQTVPAGTETTTVTGLAAATSYTFRLRARLPAGTTSYSNQATGTTFLAEPEPCVADPTTLCLNHGRFKAEVTWRDFAGATGPGTDAGLVSDDSGLLWFFDADNWEMLIKVLDGCAITQHFWVFAAATTNVEYTLRVTDSLTGFAKTYTNALGVSAPAVTDTAAFATCGATAPFSTPRPTVDAKAPSIESAEKQGACVASATRLCLNDDRFEVEIDWKDFEGATGSGRMDPFQSADSGLMYFFSPNNLEVLVKVLDGCAINDRVWVFAAATTDVEYTLRVRDTLTDATKTWFNRLGNAADAITDTDAFDACPVSR